jgi:AcrR family transcriptional regulator
MGACPLVNGRGPEEGSHAEVPTGVAIRDARQQLFEAAERVLARDGVNGFTSRAVTTEAGCAKGVLHRHFPDFDTFLAELVLDRVARVDRQSDALQAAAGTSTVAGNLTGALTELFGPVAEAVLGLVISRDALRARLRQGGSTGVPILTEAAGMIASYLAKERELGRIKADADVDTLAPALIGAAHLLFAGRKGMTIEAGAVHKVVATVIAGVLSGPTARGGADTTRASPPEVTEPSRKRPRGLGRAE